MLCQVNNIYNFIVSVTDPIPATPEPPIKRPNQLDIMPVSNYNFRKSSSVSFEHIYYIITFMI